MSGVKLNEFIYKVNKPCVFRGILSANETSSNTACDWTPSKLAELLADEKLTFRIGKRMSSDIQFENECDYVDASVEQFVAWKDGLKSSSSSPSTPEPTSGKKLKLEHECSSSSSSSDDDPFEGYDIDECWAYADYKYMIELARLSATQQCIDWSAFGFEMRNASDSTLWLATRGAYTPCHYDSYGYNLVAQIFGT